MSFTFFWNDDQPNGFLSNWYPCRFTVDGVSYQNTEQFFMAQKAATFADWERYRQILDAATPKECKDLGRQVTPFDHSVWELKSYEIMKTGCRAKFAQNPDLLALLLSTGNSVLAEASPVDGRWGIRLDAEAAAKIPPEQWPGQNRMGRILTELREEFR